MGRMWRRPSCTRDTDGRVGVVAGGRGSSTRGRAGLSTQRIAFAEHWCALRRRGRSVVRGWRVSNLWQSWFGQTERVGSRCARSSPSTPPRSTQPRAEGQIVCEGGRIGLSESWNAFGEVRRSGGANLWRSSRLPADRRKFDEHSRISERWSGEA